MNRILRPLAGLSLCAMFAAATSAAAQDQPPAPPSGQAWAAHAHARAEAKIHALHDLLNIRADQDAAFQTFVAAMHPHHDKPAQPPAGGDMDSLTTPQRLDRMAARIADHQARFQAHAEAIKQFYAVLSPEQQRAFDALPILGMMGRMGGHGGPHGPGGMGPGHMDHDGGDHDGMESVPSAPPAQ